MSCGKDINSGSCVCDILSDIARKQRPTPECQGGCEESLRELAGFVSTQFNTIPIQLICNSEGAIEGTCGSVFVARGFRRNPTVAGGLLEATSTLFRVSSVDEERCCADLELLCETGIQQIPDTLECLTPTPSIPVITRTGICVTVSLNCFCGVVCLPAVNAQMATVAA